MLDNQSEFYKEAMRRGREIHLHVSKGLLSERPSMTRTYCDGCGDAVTAEDVEFTQAILDLLDPAKYQAVIETVGHGHGDASDNGRPILCTTCLAEGVVTNAKEGWK